MELLVANPFKFGDPVVGDSYLPRPNLSQTVKNFLTNRIHVVLIGPRRFGKTSFALNLLEELEQDGYSSIFVDIFNITSHRDFLQQFLRSIQPKRSLTAKLAAWWKGLKKAIPKISADIDLTTGSSSLGCTLNLREEDVKTIIQDLLERLSDLGKKVIVVIDEFQRISEIDDEGWLEATLRAHFQRLKNVSFLFTGSRKSLISEMLNDPGRPFYRSCQVIDFPKFGPEFTEWILERFDSLSIACERQAVDNLRLLVQDTPNYVQMVCFHMVADAIKNINCTTIEIALEKVARQNAYAYQTLLNTLTPAQVRALRLAANEKQSLFHRSILSKYEITSPAALHSSLHALKTKGILDEEGTRKGHVLFDDPLLAIWLSH